VLATGSLERRQAVALLAGPGVPQPNLNYKLYLSHWASMIVSSNVPMFSLGLRCIGEMPTRISSSPTWKQWAGSTFSLGPRINVEICPPAHIGPAGKQWAYVLFGPVCFPSGEAMVSRFFGLFVSLYGYTQGCLPVCFPAQG